MANGGGVEFFVERLFEALDEAYKADDAAIGVAALANAVRAAEQLAHYANSNRKW
jgi:hypothetical protein